MNEEIFQYIVEKFKLLHIILLKSKVCNKNDMEYKNCAVGFSKIF